MVFYQKIMFSKHLIAAIFVVAGSTTQVLNFGKIWLFKKTSKILEPNPLPKKKLSPMKKSKPAISFFDTESSGMS